MTDRSQVGFARRQAERIAVESGLSDDDAARAALITVEAATNIIRHGQAGSILLNPAPPGAAPAVLIVAADTGPGIADLETALADGHSSAGGMGGGLGAIRRMSDWLDIYTRPGRGAVVAAIVGEGASDSLARACGMLAPMPGLTVCGDGWDVRRQDGALWALMCDGLGHGEKAAVSTEAAIEAFQRDSLSSMTDLIGRLDAALRRHRGAAALVARLSPDEAKIQAAGVGNITGAIVDPDGRVQRLVSQGGVIGGEARAPSPLDYDWGEESVLVMATDGLRTVHDFAAWPGLFRHGPLTIAATIYRDLARGSDDTGLLAVKARAA